jgi:hypothetical protein
MAVSVPSTPSPSVTEGEALDTMSDLSAPRRRLLEVIMTGGSNLGVRALCRKAKISHFTYYACMADPVFRKARRQCFEAGVGGAGQILKYIKKNMKMDGRDGASDRRLAAEICEMLPAKSAGSAMSDFVEAADKLLTMANLLWMYQRLNFPPERWIPAVRDPYQAGCLRPEMPPFPWLLENQEDKETRPGEHIAGPDVKPWEGKDESEEEPIPPPT